MPLAAFRLAPSFTTGVLSMPSPRPGRRLLAALLTAALPALLTGLLPVQALAVGGNLNTIDFTDVKTNGNLPDKGFQFSPPAGVKVIDDLGGR